MCIPAIWPETFCYVLSEALLGGVPVVATDIGALGERVKKSGMGWLLPQESTAQDYLRVIDEIVRNPAQLAAMKTKVLNYKDYTIRDMSKAYMGHYRFAHRDVRMPDNYSEICQQLVLPGGCVVDAGGNDNARKTMRIMELENELHLIKNTVGYKALLAARQMRIPFRAQIKACLYKIAKLMKVA